jgi:hypothetical protein
VNRLFGAIVLLAGAIVADALALPIAAAETDLDGFMRQVLVRRDDNWKKLQQYILDERQQIEIRGPARISLWGERRDYTWYLRDGFFVRSPVKVDGVVVGEADRVKAEAEYLQRVQRRDQRNDQRRADLIETLPVDAPTDVAGLIRQSRQPEFISSAYFLRFKFDAGTYALVGREQLEGREVLRIEYYPTKLFSNGRERQDGQEGRERQERRDRQNREDSQFNRLMNKVALITLWIEPASHQIVKYTYDNVALDFLPAQWLVHVDDVRATMTMGQPFPDVWLPRGLDMNAALTFALGRVEFRYALDYHDYRQADATVKVR